MPMPLVAPKPSLLPDASTELRLGAPLLAQEASYLAASARISSLSLSSIAHEATVWLYSIAQASCPGRAAPHVRRVKDRTWPKCVGTALFGHAPYNCDVQF